MPEKEIGKISHYYSKLSVGIIELSDILKVGDNIHIKGHSTDINQSVDSIEVEHQKVNEAKAGESVGIKVIDHVRQNDAVYKIE